MSAFSNNLKKGDQVLDTESKRQAVVESSPWSKLRAVKIKFLPVGPIRRVDVMQLRMVVDGKAEDVPPVTGEPPPLHGKRTPPVDLETDPLGVLKAQKAKNQARMDAITQEFKALRILNDRLDRAIEALEAPAATSAA